MSDLESIVNVALYRKQRTSECPIVVLRRNGVGVFSQQFTKEQPVLLGHQHYPTLVYICPPYMWDKGTQDPYRTIGAETYHKV